MVSVTSLGQQGLKNITQQLSLLAGMISQNKSVLVGPLELQVIWHETEYRGRFNSGFRALGDT